MDHYQILGVPRDATPDDIKKAYRRLASQHHPDKGGDTATFQKIEEAYRVLSDPNTKHQYDNPMHQNPFNGFQQGGFSFNFNGFDINDIFGQMFRQQGHAQRNHAYRTVVNLTLEQSYFGGSIPLKLQTPGQLHAVTIEIPRSVQTGGQVRYDNLIPGASLIVEFRVEPHLKFERKGMDLYCNHQISVLDLIVGTKFNFTTISGKEFVVDVPPKTQPYNSLKIVGQGMPVNNTPAFGDQIILLRPYIPDNIDNEITQSILRSRNK